MTTETYQGKLPTRRRTTRMFVSNTVTQPS